MTPDERTALEAKIRNLGTARIVARQIVDLIEHRDSERDEARERALDGDHPPYALPTDGHSNCIHAGFGKYLYRNAHGGYKIERPHPHPFVLGEAAS